MALFYSVFPMVTAGFITVCYLGVWFTIQVSKLMDVCCWQWDYGNVYCHKREMFRRWCLVMSVFSFKDHSTSIIFSSLHLYFYYYRPHTKYDRRYCFHSHSLCHSEGGVARVCDQLVCDLVVGDWPGSCGFSVTRGVTWGVSFLVSCDQQ